MTITCIYIVLHGFQNVFAFIRSSGHPGEVNRPGVIISLLEKERLMPKGLSYLPKVTQLVKG